MSSRSLGTLTLDLVAKTGGFTAGMTKAERDSAKWRKKVKKDVEVVGKAFAAASIASVAAIAAITVATVKSAEEIANLSLVAGTSTESFQKYAVGAKLMGVEQEKLADIFKDTADKVGDFLQTGGGPLVDFFDNIAPKIGVTADQFRNLSGPQALELYVSSLEKANLSQNEMTFFMEAIASDATLLLPLLKNNSEGFKALGEEAARAGAILDEKTLKAAGELSAAMFLMEQGSIGLKNQIAAQLLPTLSDLAVAFSDTTDQGAGVSVIADVISGSLKGAILIAVGAAAAFDLTGKRLAGMAAIIAAIPDGWDAVKSTVAVVADDLDVTAQKYATAINTIFDAGSGKEPAVNSRIRDIAKLMRDARAEASKAGKSIGDFKLTEKTAESEKARLKAQSVAAKLLSDQQNAYKNLVKSLQTDEESLTGQLRERLSVMDAIKDLSDEERNKTAGRIADAALVDAPDYSGLSPEVGGAYSEANRIDEAESQLEDWYATQLEMLGGFRQERSDLNEIWDEQELALKQEHEDSLAKIEEARRFVQLAAAEDLFGNLTDITRQFAGEQSGIFKAMFAIEKGLAIARSIVAIQTGIAQAAANPWPANLAAMASVAAATGSIISNIQAVSLSGMAHDGIDSVPENGTWFLQKGERVTTEKTSAKLDSTLNDIQSNRESGGGEGGNTRIINLFDSNEIVGDYMGSASAEKAIMNVINRNSRTIRTLAR